MAIHRADIRRVGITIDVFRVRLRRNRSARSNAKFLGRARRRHFGPRDIRINPCTSPRGVGVAQQRVDRHIDELRIAVIGMAVGERQFECLDKCVDIGRRIVAQRFQVEAFQDLQRLQQHRALAPRPAAEQCGVVEADRQRRFDIDVKIGKIILAQPAVIGLVIRDDPACDVAAVECIPRRGQAGRASTLASGGGFLIRHILNRTRPDRTEKSAAPASALRRPADRSRRSAAIGESSRRCPT